jgi:hypothetical protein
MLHFAVPLVPEVCNATVAYGHDRRPAQAEQAGPIQTKGVKAYIVVGDD